MYDCLPCDPAFDAEPVAADQSPICELAYGLLSRSGFVDFGVAERDGYAIVTFDAGPALPERVALAINVLRGSFAIVVRGAALHVALDDSDLPEPAPLPPPSVRRVRRSRGVQSVEIEPGTTDVAIVNVHTVDGALIEYVYEASDDDPILANVAEIRDGYEHPTTRRPANLRARAAARAALRKAAGNRYQSCPTCASGARCVAHAPLFAELAI